MKKIKLFHSYIYLQNSKNMKYIDNKIYDKNGNFILGLLNIPEENELYKVFIQKYLISNKLSKKKSHIHSYYNKSNAKVYLEVDCDKLFDYVKNNKVIPYKNIVFNLLQQNYLHLLEHDKNIFDILCLNKNHRKEINLMENITYQSVNPYIVDIYNLSFNLKSKTIIEKETHNFNIDKLVNNNGYLFICDDIGFTINTFLNKNMIKSSIIVTNNKSTWQEYLVKCNYNTIICTTNELKNYNKQHFDRIIYDNISCENFTSHINANKKWYISNKVSKITIHDIKYILNTFLNIKLTNIDETILYSLSKIIYYRNFFDYYKKNKSLILKYHKLKTITLPKFETVLLDNSNILNDFCCVCYNKFDISTLCRTSCQPKNHYFCQSCITKILDDNYDAKCPSCRQKIDKSKVKKVINDPNILDKETHELSCLLLKLFNKNTENIIICLSGNKYYKFIKNMLNLVKRNSKIITNEKTLYQKQTNHIPIINLNNFDYNNVTKISRNKKIDIYSINTNNEALNNFLVNLKKYYENICCETFI